MNFMGVVFFQACLMSGAHETVVVQRFGLTDSSALRDLTHPNMYHFGNALAAVQHLRRLQHLRTTCCQFVLAAFLSSNCLGKQDRSFFLRSQ